MPVTFYPTTQKAATHTRDSLEPGVLYDQAKSTAGLVFQSNVHSLFGEESKIGSDHLFQSSLPMQGPVDEKVVPVPNGLMDITLEAYNHHRTLVLRPDDIWVAILTQFNAFVNANAEELRSSFVQHEGKKELYVDMSSRDGMDVEYFSKEMLSRLEENITDPAIREWIIPDFTTTTQLDKTVGAIIMMSTFQKYFEYTGGAECGLPAVTLEGEKKDWQSIVRRIEKLKDYGVHTTAWYHLLRPILRRFVKAFDEPNSDENLKFWRQIVHEHEMSGGAYTTGWINAFTVFNVDGKWVGPRFKDETAAKEGFTTEDLDLEATEFWEKYLAPPYHGDLKLDSVAYGSLLLDMRCPGCVTVPVKLLDGLAPLEDCSLIAGLGAFAVSSSKDMSHSVSGELDTIRSVMTWWLYTDKPMTSSALYEKSKSQKKQGLGVKQLFDKLSKGKK